VQQNIQERINHGLQDDINKVNTQSVKDALNKMNAMKSDAVFDFSSDCLMNASYKFIDHVTTLFKWFLATGKIPVNLLCTIVPIVKDNLDDIAISDNYRAIAIRSLILKWFDL